MKRSQAAMEFLLTYGWAILIVITAVSALSYFGVLSPTDWFSHDYCYIQGGLSCIDHSLTYSPPPLPTLDGTNELKIHIKNNKGFDFEITDVDIKELANKHQSFSETLDNSESVTITVLHITSNDASLIMKEGESYDIDFILTAVNDETNLPNKFIGNVKGKVN